jgi:cytidine deaminase
MEDSVSDCDDTADARPDIYIGLVCATGTDLTVVKDQLTAHLSITGYRCQIIKVSSLLAEVLAVDTTKMDEFNRIRSLMRAGDAIRAKSERGEGVGALVVSEIRRRRGSDGEIGTATAWIIDSFKNPAEVELFDRIYGRNYYTVSVYVPKEDRLERLRNRIAESQVAPPSRRHKKLARKLIKIDERAGEKTAQHVEETFPRSDYFIDGSRKISEQVRRFIFLIFGEPFITPNLDEYCMFLAKASAYRSDDLSRQVGAVIVDGCGAIVSTGANEVPLPGGGFYHEGQPETVKDNRDFKGRRDPNYTEIFRSMIELMGVLKKTGIIESHDSPKKIANELLHGRHRELMANARVRNLIEFGRVVHAEMHAITQAASLGRSVAGATLYCTTFPCHGCARHIISAGISKVVYIEPYPKSLTVRLYRREIRFAHESGEGDKRVTFRPFHGIAPVLYQRVFRYRERKNRFGTVLTWDPRTATPVGAAYGMERPTLEANVSSSLDNVLRAAKPVFDSLGEDEDGAPDSFGSDSTGSKTVTKPAGGDEGEPTAGDQNHRE